MNKAKSLPGKHERINISPAAHQKKNSQTHLQFWGEKVHNANQKYILKFGFRWLVGIQHQ